LKKKKNTLGEQLAFLSVNYSVYVAELFQALVSARDSGKATCAELLIEYRGTIKKEAIFLITKNNAVIVQFRVAEERLLEKNIHFENWMQTDKIRKQVAKKNTAHQSSLIEGLRIGMKKVNLEANVLETPEPAVVHTHFGANAKVVNAVIGDSSGKIKLCLWNELANTVTVGDTIQIKNATVAAFRGERQLRIGKSGTLNVIQNSAAAKIEQKKGISKNVIYT
jgi:replication factor A1